MNRGAKRADAAILAATIGFAVVLSVVGWLRYSVFRAQVDLGLFTQVVSSPLTGFSSTAEGGVNHFAVHFSPILFLASPIVLLARTPLALVGLQAVLSALAIPAVYLLAKRRMPVPLALLTALAAFVYPPLISMTVNDFHELAFATPTLLWLAWALDGRRFRIATILAVVSLAIKEDVSLILGALAIVVGITAWRRVDLPLAKFCGAFAIAAVAIVAVYALALRPTLAHESAASLPYYTHYYDWTYRGPTPNGYAPLSSALREHYLIGVFVPLLVLPFFTSAIALAFPGLLEVLASHEAITIDLSTHYVACWLPYVLFAFVLGLARVAGRSKIAAYAFVSASLVTSLWIDIYASPANFWYQVYRLPNARDARMEATLQSLPRDRVIAADLFLFAHLGLYPRATIDPAGASIIVADRTCDTAYCKDRILPAIAVALARHTLHLSHSDEGIEIYTVDQR